MTALTITEFADELLALIPELMKEFLRHQVEEISKGLVTLPQFMIMEHLLRHPEARMKDLAAFMGVTMPTMTGVVDRLVRDGYTERRFDENDRRTVKISLTPKGAHLTERIQKTRQNNIIHIFDKISPNDRQDYLRILKRIHQELKTRAPHDE